MVILWSLFLPSLSAAFYIIFSGGRDGCSFCCKVVGRFSTQILKIVMIIADFIRINRNTHKNLCSYFKFIECWEPPGRKRNVQLSRRLHNPLQKKSRSEVCLFIKQAGYEE